MLPGIDRGVRKKLRYKGGDIIAKIIVKSGYIKSLEHAKNLIDYAGHKLEAQELHLEDGEVQKISDKKYVEYIATRPGVEMAPNRRHGLFTLDGDADMDTEINHLAKYPDSIRWSQIISLSREDAERTGFDNRKAWQNLIRAKAAEFAKIYNISIGNLVVNAAYHDKDHHPHVHLLFYSKDSREGYVKDMKQASEKMRSLFFNEIFHEDVSYLKEQKTEQRNELDKALENSLKRMYSKDYMPPAKLPEMLLKLSDDLRAVTGKKVYGFLPPKLKQETNDILKTVIAEDKQVNSIYKRYYDTQKEFISQYIDDPKKIARRLQHFENSFFQPGQYDPKTLHNIIVRYAGLLDETAPPDTGITMQKENGDAMPFPDAGLPEPVADIVGESGAETLANSSGDAEPGAGGPVTMQNKTEKANPVQETDYNAQWSQKYKEARKYLYGKGAEQDYAMAFKLFAEEALNGNALANYDVGFMYLNGLSVKMDIRKAQFWFQKAYEGFSQVEKTDNDPYIQYRIGKMLRMGYGVEQDSSKAAEWFDRSAGQGNQFAQYSLGNLYYNGEGVEQDYGKAHSYYLLAAKQGNVFAQYELGKMYQSGVGVAANEKTADQYFCAAYIGFEALERKTGDDKLQYRLGKMNLTGIGTKPDETKAALYFGKAAKLGNTFAQYELAKLLLAKKENPGNADKALNWMAESANQGNQFAQYALGRLYLTGKDVKKDSAKAVGWLEKSAEQNNPFAQYALGKIYLDGVEAPKNPEKAVGYLTKSADQDNEFAQYALGKVYLQGRGVPKNTDRAVNYLLKSAGHNNESAQYALGRLYLTGESADKNIPKAFFWLEKAANQGNQYAQYSLGKTYLKGADVPQDKTKAVFYLSKSAEQGNEPARYLLAHSNGGNRKNAAYAAALMLRDIAYAIGKDTVRDNTYYGKNCNVFHLSQVKRKFTRQQKHQQQRNIADEISY